MKKVVMQNSKNKKGLKKAKPVGRPVKNIVDWKMLDAILQFAPSRIMCVDILGISLEALSRRCEKEKGMTFSEYKEKKMSHTKLRLQQKAIQKALDGDNVMLIFCLKNVCGWLDKVDMESKINLKPQLTIVGGEYGPSIELDTVENLEE